MKIVTFNPQARATCRFFRAMAMHKSGQVEAAAAEFKHAETELAKVDPVPGRDDLGAGNIENWLACQIARREAKTIFEKKQ
jgi:hypothetical protein